MPRGIAQMMRVGLYYPVHVKTLRSQKLRMLLTHRQLLQSKAIAIENDLHGTLRNFGLNFAGHRIQRMRFHSNVEHQIEFTKGPDIKKVSSPLFLHLTANLA